MKKIIPVIRLSKESIERLMKSRAGLVQQRVWVKDSSGGRKGHWRMQWVHDGTGKTDATPGQMDLFGSEELKKPAPAKQTKDNPSHPHLGEYVGHGLGDNGRNYEGYRGEDGHVRFYDKETGIELDEDGNMKKPKKETPTEKAKRMRSEILAEADKAGKKLAEKKPEELAKLAAPVEKHTVELLQVINDARAYSDGVHENVMRYIMSANDAAKGKTGEAEDAAKKLRSLASEAVQKFTEEMDEYKKTLQESEDGSYKNKIGGQYKVFEEKHGGGAYYTLKYRGPRARTWETLTGEMALSDKHVKTMVRELKADDDAMKALEKDGLKDLALQFSSDYSPSKFSDIASRIKKNIENADVSRLTDTLENESNKASRAVFEKTTGIQLQKGKVRDAIKQAVGDEKYGAWDVENKRKIQENADRAEKQRREDVTRGAESVKYDVDGRKTNGREYIDSLVAKTMKITESKSGAIKTLVLWGPDGYGSEVKGAKEKEYIKMLQADGVLPKMGESRSVSVQGNSGPSISTDLMKKVSDHNAAHLYGGKDAESHIKGDGAYVTEVETDSMKNWNRRRYNRLDANEQKEYEKRLSKKKTEYRLHTADNTYYTIPKFYHDYLSQKYPDKVKKAEVKKSAIDIFRDRLAKAFGANRK